MRGSCLWRHHCHGFGRVGLAIPDSDHICSTQGTLVSSSWAIVYLPRELQHDCWWLVLGLTEGEACC